MENFTSEKYVYSKLPPKKTKKEKKFVSETFTPDMKSL